MTIKMLTMNNDDDDDGDEDKDDNNDCSDSGDVASHKELYIISD